MPSSHEAPVENHSKGYSPIYFHKLGCTVLEPSRWHLALNNQDDLQFIYLSQRNALKFLPAPAELPH